MSRRPRYLFSALALLALLTLFGCRQGSKYRYTPSVQQVTPEGAEKTQGVRTFVTLDELTGGKEEGTNGHIRFRLRVENRGSSTVKLLRDRIDLIADDLQNFGTPEVKPADNGSFTVEPSGSLLVTVSFPLPHTSEDPAEKYRQLTLMWSLTVDGQTYSNSATFKRKSLYENRRYPDRYWYHDDYFYDHGPYYRGHRHSGFRFHLGQSYHW